MLIDWGYGGAYLATDPSYIVGLERLITGKRTELLPPVQMSKIWNQPLQLTLFLLKFDKYHLN